MAKKDKTPAEVLIDWGKEDKSGGNFVRKVPDGDYPFEISGIKKGESESSGNPMLTFTFKGTDGKVKGKQTRDYFVLMPNNLFKLRQMLEAAGQDVPDKKSALKLKGLIGTPVGITLGQEEYEGKMRSKPQDYLPIEDVNLNGSDDDEELDLKGLQKKAKKLGVKGAKSMSEKKLRKAVSKAEDEADTDLEELDLDDV